MHYRSRPRLTLTLLLIPRLDGNVTTPGFEVNTLPPVYLCRPGNLCSDQLQLIFVVSQFLVVCEQEPAIKSIFYLTLSCRIYLIYLSHQSVLNTAIYPIASLVNYAACLPSLSLILRKLLRLSGNVTAPCLALIPDISSRALQSWYRVHWTVTFALKDYFQTTFFLNFQDGRGWILLKKEKYWCR